ncbi:hypothetical protein ASZ90_019481 [hydrocarbon metagenome]|uniref:Uncharacterized protein n=1 Tax=hydrocarbon metagenome TaxID=938273 RepID=A0A0W8E3J0_9ZZZZ
MIFARNSVTNELVSEVKKQIELNGKCRVSFNVIGRTKHELLSGELAQILPEYHFDIGYNYQCKITIKSETENI